MHAFPLSNRSLVRSLFDLYYRDRDPLGNGVTSSHWQHYSEDFVVELDDRGDVRRLEGAAFGVMFAPDWTKRMFSWLCNTSYFLRLSGGRRLWSMMPRARRLCRTMGFHFSYDCFRQMASLAEIMRHMAQETVSRELCFLMIGDGYGYLSSLVKVFFPSARIVLVDLGKTLLFQAVYCQKAHPDCRHVGVFEGTGFDDFDFLYCPADQLAALGSLQFDVAINIASMQEMAPEVVNVYFDFLRRHLRADNLFYCCNRERKELPGGEVLEFLNYPWQDADRHLVDGHCPWFKYFLGLERTQRGPRVLGLRVPLVNYFDGPVMHRLSVLAVSEEASSRGPRGGQIRRH